MKYAMLIILPLLFILSGCSPAHAPTPAVEDGGRYEISGARQEDMQRESSAAITSTDIIDFECDFFGRCYDMLYDHCHFTAKKDGDAVFCIAEGNTCSDVPFHVEFTAETSMLTDLQSIVAENELAKRNGFYGHTSGLPYGIGGSLQIGYASGEKLVMSDNADVPFPCVPFCELFERYAEKAGYLFRLDEKLYVPEDWAAALSGHWVYMGEDANAQSPEIYSFTEDNKAYASPEFYEEAMREGGIDFYDEWFLQDGKPIYRANPDDEAFMREYRIALTDSEHMQLIDQKYGDIRHFVKNSAPEAIAFLEQSPYYYLADYGPRLCYARLGEYFGEGDFSVEIKDVIPVKGDDHALIEEYGLENASFDKGYALVVPKDAWHSALHLEGDTKYSVLDVESDDPTSKLKTVTSEEFVKILKERGEMLAYVREAEAVLLSLEEFYGA